MMTELDLILCSAMLMFSSVLRSHAINWNSTFPRLTCYKCDTTYVKQSEDYQCVISPNKLKDRKDGLISGDTYKWTGDYLLQYGGMVLPLRPYCYTRLAYYYPEGVRGAAWKRIQRGIGYPGWGNPPDCLDEPNQAGPDYFRARYIYYLSDYCNADSFAEIKFKCYQGEDLSYLDGDGPDRALEQPVENTTLTGSSYRHAFKHCTLIMTTLLGLKGAGFLSTRPLLAALILFLPAPSRLFTNAVVCYSCGDPKITSPPDNLCNNYAPATKDTAKASCPDRKPPPNNIGMTMQQKGYCAVWISQAFTESPAEIEKAMTAGQPLRPKMWLERGCAYPGGEPDECVTADARLTNRRMWTFHYCDTDWCNNETVYSFISRCFPTSNSTVASSLNDGRSFEGFVFPVLPPLPTATMNPQITTKQDIQVTPESNTSDPRSRSNSVSASRLLTLAVAYPALINMLDIFRHYSVIKE